MGFERLPNCCILVGPGEEEVRHCWRSNRTSNNQAEGWVDSTLFVSRPRGRVRLLGGMVSCGGMKFLVGGHPGRFSGLRDCAAEQSPLSITDSPLSTYPSHGSENARCVIPGDDGDVWQFASRRFLLGPRQGPPDTEAFDGGCSSWATAGGAWRHGRGDAWTA